MSSDHIRQEMNLPWRAQSVVKRSTPAGVSLVFAEPEQGSPLVPAVTKLSATKLTESKETDKCTGTGAEIPPSTSVFQSDGTSSQLASTSLSKPVADPVSSVEMSAELSQPRCSVGEASHGTGNDLDPKQPSPKLDATAASTHVQNNDVNVAGESNKSTSNTTIGFSWFGSLSKSKGKEKANGVKQSDRAIEVDRSAGNVQVAHNMAEPTTQEPLPALSSGTSPPPSAFSETSVISSQPQIIPNKEPNDQNVWMLPSGSSLPGPAASLHPLSSQASLATPSSFDGNVSKPPRLTYSSPDLAILASKDITTTNALGGKLKSLNSSSSRFSISIPILGRSKIRSEQAVGEGQSDGGLAGVDGIDREATPDFATNEAALLSSTTIQSTVQTLNSNAETLSPTSSSVPQLNLENPRDLRAGLPVQTQNRVTSGPSWWNYIGFTSQGDISTSKLPLSSTENYGQEVPPLANPFPDPQSDTNQPAANEQSLPLDDGTLHDLQKTASNTDAPKRSPEEKKPKSLLSAESRGSAWYAPWTWYSVASRASPTSSGPEAESLKTESELVKEEALSRDTCAVTPPSPEFMSGRPSFVRQVTNPIESSISTNNSGWASFFTTKSLGMKPITAEERKDSTMEVMDVDIDDLQLNATTESGKRQATKEGHEGDSKTQTPSSPTLSTRDAGEPKESAAPLTNSNSVKRDNDKANASRRMASPAPSKNSTKSSPTLSRPPAPNVVLPTWDDVFLIPPRSTSPPLAESTLTRTIKYVSGMLFPTEENSRGKGKGKARDLDHFGQELPKAWSVCGAGVDVLQGAKSAVVIGVHGWFPGAVMRSMLGEPTGTSSKLVSMMMQALDQFQDKHKVKLQKITPIPLEGEGTIDRRVEKLYRLLISNKQWMDDLHAADVVFVAAHSQGSVVSTHLLDRLIRERHIRTSRNKEVAGTSQLIAGENARIMPSFRPQKVCCLALCGIHLGPMRYLTTNTLVQPYIQYFESMAARELFEFQNTESEVSRAYVKALGNVLNHGTKMVYVASLNDQVVPLYSGVFSSASHPLILRALYIDGDAYRSSDFLSNLLVLLLRILNSGLKDSGLLAHLSEATAGSLHGVGHSTPYEELATFSLAVEYLFLANSGSERYPDLVVEPFDAMTEQNDYEIPWALRDLIADERVVHFFAHEIAQLREGFREWHPKTTILRDVKRKLQPIQRLPPLVHSLTIGSYSKL